MATRAAIVYASASPHHLSGVSAVRTSLDSSRVRIYWRTMRKKRHGHCCRAAAPTYPLPVLPRTAWHRLSPTTPCYPAQHKHNIAHALLLYAFFIPSAACYFYRYTCLPVPPAYDLLLAYITLFLFLPVIPSACPYYHSC